MAELSSADVLLPIVYGIFRRGLSDITQLDADLPESSRKDPDVVQPAPNKNFQDADQSVSSTVAGVR